MPEPTVQDRRSRAQLHTHIWGVVGHDIFLSGWGKARGGKSEVAWAFPTYEMAEAAVPLIKSRGDIKRVGIVDLRLYIPHDYEHFAIYPVDRGHVYYNRDFAPDRTNGRKSR